MPDTVDKGEGYTSRVTVASGPGTYTYTDSTMAVTVAGVGCQWTGAPVPAGAAPLQVDVTCTSLTNGTPTADGQMKFQITSPPTSPQPNAVEVIYRIPNGPSYRSPADSARTTDGCEWPQLVYANTGECSVVRVPNAPDCYSYQAGMTVKVTGGAYKWAAEAVPGPAGCPLYLRLRCCGPVVAGGGRCGESPLLVTLLTNPLPAHQPAPILAYYLRGGGGPPAHAVVTCPPR